MTNAEQYWIARAHLAASVLLVIFALAAAVDGHWVGAGFGTLGSVMALLWWKAVRVRIAD